MPVCARAEAAATADVVADSRSAPFFQSLPSQRCPKRSFDVLFVLGEEVKDRLVALTVWGVNIKLHPRMVFKDYVAPGQSTSSGAGANPMIF
jgi:hypothetical protein